MQNDRLEEMWRHLGEEIKRREKELAVLKKKFETLDAARLVLVSDTPYGEAAAAKAQEKLVPAPSLQAGVLEYLHQSLDENGSTAANVANALRPRFSATYKNNNSFYTSVLVTLMRLTSQGRARMIKPEGAAARRFFATDVTRSLFARNKEAVQ